MFLFVSVSASVYMSMPKRIVMSGCVADGCLLFAVFSQRREWHAVRVGVWVRFMVRVMVGITVGITFGVRVGVRVRVGLGLGSGMRLPGKLT